MEIIGELRSSKEWYEHLYPNKELVIMDPDGWDRKNWDFSWSEEKITYSQFMSRLLNSTCLTALK